MLTITVESDECTDIREQALPEMLELARRTGCRIILGGVLHFSARPTDTIETLRARFDDP